MDNEEKKYQKKSDELQAKMEEAETIEKVFLLMDEADCVTLTDEDYTGKPIDY